MYNDKNNYRGNRNSAYYRGDRGQNRDNNYSYGNGDRYHHDSDRRYRAGREAEESDYGPFSNIYDDHSPRRGDFDTRYNEQRNYYYDNGPQNDRSDEARGQSLRDVFRGGRRSSERDREYFTSYREGGRYGNDPQYSLYGSENSAYYNRQHYGNGAYESRHDDGDDFRGWYNRQDPERDERRYYRRDEGKSMERSRQNSYQRRNGFNDGYLY